MMRRSKRQNYSITSSAVANISGGKVQPMACAVLRLIISSNLVTCSTGRSAGLSALQDFVYEIGAAPIHLGQIFAVGHQPARRNPFPRNKHAR